MSEHPAYWAGALGMSAALAVKELPKDPKYAKSILERTLREYLPNASAEVQKMLREEGVK